MQVPRLRISFLSTREPLPLICLKVGSVPLRIPFRVLSTKTRQVVYVPAIECQENFAQDSILPVLRIRIRDPVPF
jgi:hypothetical protein